MKVEWWYDEATFHYSDNSELYLAKLIVRDDGTAKLISAGEALEFDNEEEASLWLCDEEFLPIDVLLDRFAEQVIAVDPRIQALVASSDDAVLQQKGIILDPAGGVLSPRQSDTLFEPKK
ncbi:MAG TPA: hypothetical protein VKI65_20715 [Gemmataceae bacterium]|nr:hypothetical protein [Gemmataceae bacterium]